MQRIKRFVIKSNMVLFITLLVLCLEAYQAQSTSANSSYMTNGEWLKIKTKTIYNAERFKTYTNTTSWNCLIIFSAEPQYFSMNIVGTNLSNLDCQLMDTMANEKMGLLTEEDESIYYEKIEKLKKPVFTDPSPVTVGDSIIWDCTAMGSIPPPLFSYTITRGAGGPPVAISSPYSPKQGDDGAIVTCIATHTGNDVFSSMTTDITLVFFKYLFINEFHYDNSGTDIDEFIELAGSAGLDLSSWSIVLYSGTAAIPVVYETIPLSGVLPDDSNGFGFHSVALPTNGIQNGEKDGIALVKTNGSVSQAVEFLSYEGSFAAIDGPASGQISADVGIYETDATPVGFSLQRTGTGSNKEDFTWAANPKTPGNRNTGQTLT